MMIMMIMYLVFFFQITKNLQINENILKKSLEQFFFDLNNQIPILIYLRLFHQKNIILNQTNSEI